MAAITTGHIEIKPSKCGGKPHIAGHRITVQNIVVWHERMGQTPDDIATEYDLTLGDVHAALTYYHDHRAEIDEAIRTDETFVAELRLRTPSKLAEKLRGRAD